MLQWQKWHPTQEVVEHTECEAAGRQLDAANESGLDFGQCGNVFLEGFAVNSVILKWHKHFHWEVGMLMVGVLSNQGTP